MPVIIPEKLPATEELRKLGIFVMNEQRAKNQDIRPLKLCILNLMPDKISTETQILSKLSNSMIQVDITLLAMKSHISKNTSQSHLDSFYYTFQDIKDNHFDALIITGAPVEMLDFEQVDYWQELVKVLNWSRTNVYTSLFICWGSQAALYHFYGVEKVAFDQKLFGVFPTIMENPADRLFVGMNDILHIPQSRHTTSVERQIRSLGNLDVLASSKDTGIHLAATKDRRQVFMTGHPEYDTDTLEKEYVRDSDSPDVQLPKNYFVENNPKKEVITSWKSDAGMFYSNWLNYYVYQETDYELGKKNL